MKIEEELEETNFFGLMRQQAIEAPALHSISGVFAGSTDAVKMTAIAKGACVTLEDGAVLWGCTIEEGAELTVGANSVLINLHLGRNSVLDVGASCTLVDIDIETRSETDNKSKTRIGDAVRVLGLEQELAVSPASCFLGSNSLLICVSLHSRGSLEIEEDCVLYKCAISLSSGSTLTAGRGCQFIICTETGDEQAKKASLKQLLQNSNHAKIEPARLLHASDNVMLVLDRKSKVCLGEQTKVIGRFQLFENALLTTNKAAFLYRAPDDRMTAICDNAMVVLDEGASLLSSKDAAVVKSAFKTKKGEQCPSVFVYKGKGLALTTATMDVEV